MTPYIQPNVAKFSRIRRLITAIIIVLNELGTSTPPHCSDIGPGGLRAPCVFACAMRSLAIVFTNFRSLSLSPSFAFDPVQGKSHVRNNFSPNIFA